MDNARIWIALAAGCVTLAATLAQAAAEDLPLPGTKALTWREDIASRLVAGVDEFLLREIDRVTADADG